MSYTAVSEQTQEMSELHPSQKAAANDIERRVDGSDLKQDEEDDSPFEVVRATVSNKDDPTLVTRTFRFWVLGILFTVILSFVNQFFWFRATPLVVGVLVVQLLSFPLGKGLERILPNKVFHIGPFSFNLNPAPFNIKEHVLITACANAAASTAYAIDIVTIKKIFYHQDLGFFPSFLLVLTTQCLGYGLAGICRRFLVRPAAMIWPANLVNVSLFRTLHEEEDSSTRGITRIRFFLLVATSSFFYYFFPGYLASFLSTISLLCYIAPTNKIANQLGSGNRGVGLLSFSLDWNYVVSYLTSPLVTPFWAGVNIFIGFILVAWVLVPIGFFNDLWDAQKFPILSSELFDSSGHKYKTLDLLNDDLSLNNEKYAELGPPRLTFFFAISYGMGFATLAAVVTHTILYHGKEIMARVREARSEDDDIHARLMDRYPEVPDWWYLGVFLVNLVLAIVVCEFLGADLPWWGLLLAVFMAGFFLIPIGIITAVSNQTPGLNIITEFVIGYIMPGKPIANVTFKTYGYISMVQAIIFLGDLKLGHYMKIPPRDMFISQTAGTVIAGLINLSTAYLMFSLKPDICMPENKVWSCDSARVFYAASVIWGVIGPNRMFGSEGYYSVLMWFFLIGALLPIPFWLLSRRSPKSWMKYIHIPVLLGGTAIMPPARPAMYPTWFLLGFIFQFVIYRYRHQWWNRFNFILSAGLDSGVAIAGVIIFFAFQYHEIEIDWWGNKPDCTNFKL